MGELEVLVEEDGLCVARCGPILYGSWFGPVTRQHIDAFARALERVATSLVAVTIIDTDRAQPPDDDARARSDEVLTSARLRYRAEAVLLRGSGFRAATARALMTGQRLLQRVRYPWKVFTDRDSAAQWIATAAEAERDLVASHVAWLMARPV